MNKPPKKRAKYHYIIAPLRFDTLLYEVNFNVQPEPAEQEQPEPAEQPEQSEQSTKQTRKRLFPQRKQPFLLDKQTLREYTYFIDIKEVRSIE